MQLQAATFMDKCKCKGRSLPVSHVHGIQWCIELSRSIDSLLSIAVHHWRTWQKKKQQEQQLHVCLSLFSHNPCIPFQWWININPTESIPFSINQSSFFIELQKPFSIYKQIKIHVFHTYIQRHTMYFIRRMHQTNQHTNQNEFIVCVKSYTIHTVQIEVSNQVTSIA